MTLLRRFLVLQLLMFWQGGFFFYALVVVPIGSDVLGGKFEQGKITRLVSADMNLAGIAALAVFAWEFLAEGRKAPRWRWLLLSSWLIMAAGLTALMLLHPRMLEMIDVENSRFNVPRIEFRVLHRTYLWISTAQWAAGLLFALALIQSWRKTDQSEARAHAVNSEPKTEH